MGHGSFPLVLPAMLGAAALLSNPAEAYVKTLTPGGASVSWRGEAKLNLAGNPTNSSGLSTGDVFDAVVRGLQRWKAASGGAVSFDYWQEANSSVYERNSNYNGLSSLYFVSGTGSGLPSNVLGLTQVWYSTSTGKILETDIALNDVNYQFTTNPRDTTGYGSGAGGGRRVFLENVLTHELGHAYGLSHSGGLQSTMLFMESPEQAYLSCDEQAGIRAIYGGPAPSGSIQGRVVSARTGAPVFGAHVVAISRLRGTAMATALTNTDGNYSISGLEAGTYYLMAEPYYAGASALPNYYAGINANVCPGGAFSRTFLADGGGNGLSAVSVPSGGAASGSTLAVECDSTGAAVGAFPGSDSFASAPVVQTGAAGGFGVVDRFSGSSTLYYRLSAVSGTVRASALGYSLYSPVAPAMRLLDSGGRVVASATVADGVYVGASGYVNRDSALVATGLAPGDYYVEVSGARMSSTAYPAGPISLDAGAFIVVTGSVNGGDPSSAFPFNARCRMDESFAAYTSPGGLPPRFVAKDDSEDQGGGCGTIARDRGPRGGGGGSGFGGGAGAARIAGWFLPFFLMGAAVRGLRRFELHARRAAATL